MAEAEDLRSSHARSLKLPWKREGIEDTGHEADVTRGTRMSLVAGL